MTRRGGSRQKEQLYKHRARDGPCLERRKAAPSHRGAQGLPPGVRRLGKPWELIWLCRRFKNNSNPFPVSPSLLLLAQNAPTTVLDTSERPLQTVLDHGPSSVAVPGAHQDARVGLYRGSAPWTLAEVREKKGRRMVFLAP